MFQQTLTRIGEISHLGGGHPTPRREVPPFPLVDRKVVVVVVVGWGGVGRDGAHLIRWQQSLGA